jgi:uncharacterized protein (UPF0335 family)
MASGRRFRPNDVSTSLDTIGSALYRRALITCGDTMTESIAADELRLLIERIERLEEEKKSFADDIRDVYSEAKSRGYDAKIMRQIVRLRKMESHDRQEMEAILDTYKAALGLG